MTIERRCQAHFVSDVTAQCLLEAGHDGDHRNYYMWDEDESLYRVTHRLGPFRWKGWGLRPDA